jgi:hypothetical protein
MEAARGIEVRVDDVEAKVFFKWIEVAVAMQQRMTVFYAEGGNEAVDGPTDRMAFIAEMPIIQGGGNGQSLPATNENFEPG